MMMNIIIIKLHTPQKIIQIKLQNEANVKQTNIFLVRLKSYFYSSLIFFFSSILLVYYYKRSNCVHARVILNGKQVYKKMQNEINKTSVK